MTSQRKRKAKLTRQSKETIKKKQLDAAPQPAEIMGQEPAALDDVVSLDKQQLASVLSEIKETLLGGIADGVNEELRNASPLMRRKIEDNTDMLRQFLGGLREGMEMEIADYIEQAGDKVSVSLKELSDNFTKALEPLVKGEGIIKEMLEPKITIVNKSDEAEVLVEPPNSVPVSDPSEPTPAQNPVDPTKPFARKEKTTQNKATDKVANLAVKARSTPTTKGLGFGTKASIFMQDVLANTVGIQDSGIYNRIRDYQLRKEHFVKNESEARSEEFKGMSESEKRKQLVTEFKSEDSKVKEMTQVNERVEEMRAKGYDDNVINMTSAGARRQELAKELANSPTSRFNEPFFKDQAATPAVNPKPTPVNEEAQAEAMAEDEMDDAVQKDQAASLENIDKNTADLKEAIDGLKVSMKEAAAAGGSGGSGFDIGGLMPGGKGPKKIPKGGKAPTRMGKILAGGGKLLGHLKGGLIGAGIGIGADYLADSLGRDTKAGAAADITGQAATYAGLGATIGSFVPGIGTLVGGAVGGVAGAAKGLYDNWGTISGGDKVTAPKTLPPNVANMQQSTGGELPPESKKFAEELGKNIVVRVPPPTVVPGKADTKIIEPSFTTRIKNNEPSISDYLRSRYAAS